MGSRIQKHKNTGFNLSSTHDFSFNILQDADDKITGELILKTNKPPRIFDDKIIDIKAIVGTNGAGKTTVIEALLECILTKNNPIQFIAICDNYKIYTTTKIKLQNSDLLQGWSVDSINLPKGKKRVSLIGQDFPYSIVIRYCPIFNFDNLINFPDGIEGLSSKYQNSQYVDISNEGILESLIYQLRNNDISEKNIFVSYKHKESENIIRLFNNTTIVNKLNSFFRYKKSDLTVELTFDFGYTEKVWRNSMVLEDSNFYEWVLSFNKQSEKIYIELVSFLIICELTSLNKTISDNEYLLKILKNLDLSQEPKYVINEYLTKSDFFVTEKKNVLLFIKKVRYTKKYNPGSSSYRNLLIDSTQTDDLLELIFPLSLSGFHFDLISISYSNFSSGEKTLITFLSRLQSILETFGNSPRSSTKEIIFILDEPDITLHPEWQRVYLSFLNNLLPYFFRESYYLRKTKIQIILTSHSPLMLSDLPNENILYLSKDDKNNCEVKKVDSNTFAANIHSLYANSFFLKSGKMAMGQHATEIIKDIIKEIKSGELKDPKNTELIVSSIGEPLIKNQLRDMLSTINAKIYVEDIEDPLERIRKLNDLLDKAKREEENKNKPN